MPHIHKLYSLTTLALFFGFTIWWVMLHIFHEPASISHEIFAATYGVMALWGGIVGLVAARAWGGWRSIMGRALLLFSLGLLLQEFGQLSYSYFIWFKHIDVPYPSIGDIGYFGSIPVYIYGVVLLGKAAGAHVSLRSYAGRIKALLIPVVLLAVSYASFLLDYPFGEVGGLTLFLDFGYPLGQAIYVSLAILVYLLSRTMLGGIMKQPLIILLLALVAQYVADYMFLYQTIQETWQVGGVNDYSYLFSYTLMTIGLLSVFNSLGTIRVGGGPASSDA